MITVLTGENNFELTRALDSIVVSFAGTAEKFEGSDLDVSHLPDLFMGATLFADKRLVIIKNLSDNKSIWEMLPAWLARIGDDFHLVLVEPKLDKRTKTYKDLKKLADVKEFAGWGDRDSVAAEAWVIAEAKQQGFTLDKKSAQTLVSRVGLDQWQLFYALQKLSVLDEVTPDIINSIVEAAPNENVFNLFEAALRGDGRKVIDMIHTLQRTQDPYMTFGLLSSQVFQLAALASTDKPSVEVAKDIGAHPYALSKLSSYAKKLNQSDIRKIVRYFADADTAMKSSATNPWLLIEEALIKTSVL